MQTQRIITVFGGTGFLGRQVVSRLLQRGLKVRVASRHPERVKELFRSASIQPQAIKADITDPTSLPDTLRGCAAVVNAVSLYKEKGDITFDRVHVQAARDLAICAREEGATHFIQVSGIGSDPRSHSNYIRARGRGEGAVRDAFSDSIIVRPAVMIGPGDSFLTTIIKLIRTLPVYPMFGHGQTRLQPAYVDDVAEGICRLIARGPSDGPAIFEFAGPQIYIYRELVRHIASLLDRPVRPLPVPFAVWAVLGIIGERLSLPITRNQVDLMRKDNIATTNKQGFSDLGVDATYLDKVVTMVNEPDWTS